jgi:predicted metal-dependent phosphoesterase TrpH
MLAQVKLLTLANHDIIAGIPEAMSAASKFGMRIIPRVEINARYSPRKSKFLMFFYGKKDSSCW